MREALFDQAEHEHVGPLQALCLVNRAEDDDLVRLVGRHRVHAVDVAGQDHVGDQPLQALVPGGQKGELIDVGEAVIRPLILESDRVGIAALEDRTDRGGRVPLGVGGPDLPEVAHEPGEESLALGRQE